MVKVVGYEGRRHPETLVSWGTAAVRDGDELVNPTTGLRHAFDEDEFHELVEQGAITSFNAIEIENDAASPLVVLEVRRDEDRAWKLLRLDTGALGGVIDSRKRGNFHVYIFQDMPAFERAAAELVRAILHELLYQEHDDDDWRENLLTAGFVLDPHAPALNALRVVFADEEHRDIVREISEASLRSDEDLHSYNLHLDALLADTDYSIKYEGGIAQGEGLNADDASDLLGAVSDLHSHLAARVIALHPYLEEAQPSRLKLFEAASAKLTFSASVKSETLGQRLSRYFELALLQESLAGEVPEKLAKERAFQSSLLRLVAPDEETKVTHRQLQTNTWAHVASESSTAGPTRVQWSDPVVLLGYHSGLARDARDLRVNVFPGVELRLPTDDDGSGRKPSGLTFLEDRDDFLFKPSLYRVVRKVGPGTTEKFFLTKVTAVVPGSTGVVTAIPSSIVKGAYIYNLNLAVEWSRKGVLFIGDYFVRGVNAKTLPGARTWMRDYRDICAELELDNYTAKHLAPPRMKAGKDPVIVQVLEALVKLGGKAHQRDIVATVDELYDRSIRTNNTRREMLERPEYLGPSDEDPQVLEVTENGRKYLRAFRAIARKARG